MKCPKCKHSVDKKDILYDYVGGRDWQSPTHNCHYCMEESDKLCCGEL